MRIISLATSKESIDLVIKKSIELSKRLSAKVTLLYVEPEPLIDIPKFDEDSSFEQIKEYIDSKLKKDGLDWVFFAYQADPKSHLFQEISKEHPDFIISDSNSQIDDILDEIELPIYVAVDEKSQQKATILMEKSISLQNIPTLLEKILPKEFECKMLYEELFMPDSMMVDSLTLSPASIEFDLELQEETKRNLELFCSKLKKDYSFEIFGLDFDFGSIDGLVVFWLRNRDSQLLPLAKDMIKSKRDSLIFWEK